MESSQRPQITVLLNGEAQKDVTLEVYKGFPAGEGFDESLDCRPKDCLWNHWGLAFRRDQGEPGRYQNGDQKGEGFLRNQASGYMLEVADQGASGCFHRIEAIRG